MRFRYMNRQGCAFRHRSEEVGQFILQRCNRDLPSLLQILTQLDTASLVEQRRLTIPFVKRVLAI